MYWYGFEEKNDDNSDGGDGGGVGTPVLVLYIGIGLSFDMIGVVMTGMVLVLV